jgi:predicted transcriptional regulator
MAKEKAIKPKANRIIRAPFTAEERKERERLLAELEKEKPEIIAEGRRVFAAKAAAAAKLREAFALLKQERQRQGLSLGDIEERCGISRAALSRLEGELEANPTVNTLERYAEALGKTLLVTFQALPTE